MYTLAVRLPTGGRASTPSGTSGLAVASSLCLLTPAQLGVSIVGWRTKSMYSFHKLEIEFGGAK